MTRLLLEHRCDDGFGSIPLAIALFVSVAILVALCAKRTRRTQKHDDLETSSSNNNVSKCVATPSNNKSPLASPKKLVSRIGSKAITDPFKKRVRNDDQGDHDAEIGAEEMEEGGFGEGGLWQKSILLGDKCRPPEFSGVIYYDIHGNQLPEMPRSPRASPLAGFSFPVVMDMNK